MPKLDSKSYQEAGILKPPVEQNSEECFATAAGTGGRDILQSQTNVSSTPFTKRAMTSKKCCLLRQTSRSFTVETILEKIWGS